MRWWPSLKPPSLIGCTSTTSRPQAASVEQLDREHHKQQTHRKGNTRGLEHAVRIAGGRGVCGTQLGIRVRGWIECSRADAAVSTWS